MIKKEREGLISQGITSFSKTELGKLNNNYDKIISKWKIELKDVSKVIYAEEIKLFNRMKGKDKEEILFL